jgi:hypothetical protein
VEQFDTSAFDETKFDQPALEFGAIKRGPGAIDVKATNGATIAFGCLSQAIFRGG